MLVCKMIVCPQCFINKFQIVAYVHTVKQPDRTFAGVSAVRLSGKKILAVNHNSFKHSCEHTLDSYLLIKQLADSFSFLPAVLPCIKVIEKIHDNIFGKHFNASHKLPEILCNVGELLIARFLCTAHELVHHKILTIVNGYGLCRLSFHKAFYLTVIVGMYR